MTESLWWLVVYSITLVIFRQNAQSPDQLFYFYILVTKNDTCKIIHNIRSSKFTFQQNMKWFPYIKYFQILLYYKVLLYCFCYYFFLNSWRLFILLFPNYYYLKKENLECSLLERNKYYNILYLMYIHLSHCQFGYTSGRTRRKFYCVIIYHLLNIIFNDSTVKL